MEQLRLERKVSARGQVVIPKDIRESFNMEPGQKVVFSVENGHITLESATKEEDFLEGFLNTPKLSGASDGQRIKELIKEQYEEDVH